MFIGHLLPVPLGCYRKRLQNLFHLNCGPRICQIWIQLITACGAYCKRRCTKYASLIWTNWNSNSERSGPSWTHGSYSSVASSTDQRCMFCTSSLATISHMLLLTWFKCGEFGRHSWGGVNSGVSFCNNSVVACTKWAFPASQGSVELLIRWGGKRLYHFAACLFKKQCTKFHQNCPSFIGDITKKKHFGLFFWNTV